MLYRCVPSALLVSLAGLLAADASAQTQVKLTWGAPAKTCVFTTNSDGVTANPVDGSLQATGTFDTQSGNCPSGGGVVNPPAIPNGLSGDLLAGYTNPPVNVSLDFKADADNCTTAGSTLPTAVAGWGANATLCNSNATCNVVNNVPLTLPALGNYHFQISCTRNGSAVTATSFVDTTVSSGQVDPQCSNITTPGLTRVTSASVAYVGYSPATLGVTQFAPLFGLPRNSPQGTTPVDFPGLQITRTFTIPKGQYIAVEFTVPNNIGVTTNGVFKNVFTGTNASFSTTLSKCPGDFRTPAQLEAGCYVDNNSEGNLNYVTNTASAYKCDLKSGEKWYLNIISAPLSNPTQSNCAGSSCAATVANYPAG